MDATIDRREIVDGYLYGFGTPTREPVPPDLPGYVPVAAAAESSRPYRTVAGPPLRYAILLLAVGKVWLAREEGMVPALLLLLALGFIVPLIGFLVAQARARRG